MITALFIEKQTPAEIAARYGVDRSWVYKLKARYEAEGDTALQPPVTTPEDLTGAPHRPRRSSWSCGFARNSPKPVTTPAPTPWAGS